MAKPSLLAQIPDDALAQHNKQNFMMNYNNGWMGGRMGGAMWLWSVIGVAVVVLLVLVISRVARK
jgi:uncharacterized membrane protein